MSKTFIQANFSKTKYCFFLVRCFLNYLVPCFIVIGFTMHKKYEDF